MEILNRIEGDVLGDWLISPLVGEMSPKATEGGAVPPMCQSTITVNAEDGRSTLPPSALPGISPTRGEIGCGTVFAITPELPADAAARDALLDRAMGPRWRRKSSEKLRKGRIPSEGLAFVAKDEGGAVVGTVRLWDIAAGLSGGGRHFMLPPSALPGISPTRGEIGCGTIPALLLGPLAVDPALKNSGIGSALMRRAIAEARRLGHAAILLVGDEPYYGRFGFSADRTGNLAMPGPYEKHRLLALELVPGALDGAKGVLRAAGRKQRAARKAVAA